MSGETSDGAKLKTPRGLVLIQKMKSKCPHASSYASAAGQIEELGFLFERRQCWKARTIFADETKLGVSERYRVNMKPSETHREWGLRTK